MDVRLYTYLSTKFWHQVALHDEDTCWTEVAEFNVILQQVAHYCAGHSASPTLSLLIFDKTHFTVTRNNCILFTSRLYEVIKKYYNRL